MPRCQEHRGRETLNCSVFIIVRKRTICAHVVYVVGTVGEGLRYNQVVKKRGAASLDARCLRVCGSSHVV